MLQAKACTRMQIWIRFTKVYLFLSLFRARAARVRAPFLFLAGDGIYTDADLNSIYKGTWHYGQVSESFSFCRSVYIRVFVRACVSYTYTDTYWTYVYVCIYIHRIVNTT